MGFFDKLKFRKKKNPLYDNNVPKYEGYEEDLSDDGSAGLDVYNDPTEPRDFNTESSTVEKPRISEYQSSLDEFERLNNDQLDPQSKTSMKHKKEKTLFSTLMKAFRKARYNASNSAKNGADVAKSFEIRNATKTAEEKHFKGLKKGYLYVAIGIFLTLVGMSLLFANDDDPMAKKNAPEGPKPVNGADIRPTGNKTAATRNIGALTGLPSTYADKVPEVGAIVNDVIIGKSNSYLSHSGDFESHRFTLNNLEWNSPCNYRGYAIYEGDTIKSCISYTYTDKPTPTITTWGKNKPIIGTTSCLVNGSFSVGEQYIDSCGWEISDMKTAWGTTKWTNKLTHKFVDLVPGKTYYAYFIVDAKGRRYRSSAYEFFAPSVTFENLPTDMVSNQERSGWQ